MKVRYNQSGELKAIVIDNSSSDNFNYNYWSNWIKQNDQLAEERNNLIEKLTILGLNGSEIISEAYMTTDFGNDLGLHHETKRRMLDDIRSRYYL